MGSRLRAVFVFVFALPASCTRSEPRPEAPRTEPAASGANSEPDGGTNTTKSLTVSSSAFAPGGSIPAKHTCEGGDVSPPLAIAGVPGGTKSLALVVEDPDAPDPAAPKRVWTHWVAYDFPAETRALDEGAGNRAKLGRPGKNDWGETAYRGPCPPIGQHRYFFRVFALDTELGDLHEPSKADLLKAIDGHVLARGEVFGTYQKAK